MSEVAKIPKKEFFSDRALALSLLLSIAIAATEVPLWITAFTFSMIFWKLLSEKFNVWKISSKITPFLGALIFLIVYLQYRTVLGQEESTTVLLGLVSLSILNYETERDTLFLVLLGFLILVIKSVFSLDFIWTLPSLFSFFGLWYSLLSNKNLNRYKYLMMTTLKSMPLVVLLFIFFPRLVLFQTKQSQKVIVQSGFNEDLNPGRFSEVALQNQMVFRADFGNNRMNTDELYWRGAVLNVSKGFIWQKDHAERVAMTNEPVSSGINYRILLEPLNLKNIFLLDAPMRILSASASVVQMQYQNYAISELQSQQVQIDAQSVFNHNKSDPDDPTDLPKYLKFPDLPPKTKAFVEDVKSRKLSPRARIEFLRRFFTDKGFIYTLKPETYQNNLDEFLFDRKKGFCEHFAAAFGTVARALDLPTRVVLGYQGGIYNSLGNFWRVSQKDAHAWVEVGIDGRWMRVDPTAWVTPLRITLGGENYFSLSEDEQILYSKNRDWKKPESFQGLVTEIKLALDNVNYYWTVLLLNYDLQTQLSYLKKFRGNWLFVAVVALLFGFAFLYNRKKRAARFRPAHVMQEFVLGIEVWAQKKGMRFAENETPLGALQKMAQSFPDLKDALVAVSETYIDIVYKEKTNFKNLAPVKENWKKSLKQHETKR